MYVIVRHAYSLSDVPVFDCPTHQGCTLCFVSFIHLELKVVKCGLVNIDELHIDELF